MIGGCPGSDRFKRPFPESIKCPMCGEEAEIWSDEFSVPCPKCKKVIVRCGTQNCVEWCKSAEECLGPEKFKAYKDSKEKGGK